MLFAGMLFGQPSAILCAQAEDGLEKTSFVCRPACHVNRSWSPLARDPCLAYRFGIEAKYTCLHHRLDGECNGGPLDASASAKSSELMILRLNPNLVRGLGGDCRGLSLPSSFQAYPLL